MLFRSNHPMILGEGNLIPGFEENVVGMKKGEKKEFKIKFPKEYHDKEIAGAEAKFEIELVDAKEVVLPEMDKKFAEGFGFDEIKKLKDSIEKSLIDEAEKEYKNMIEVMAIDKVLPNLKVELPESVIMDETERIIDGFRAQVEQNGLKFEKYLESMKKTAEDLKKDMRKQAEKNVKTGFLLGKIMEEKKIDPKDKEAGRKAIDHIVETIFEKKK